MLSEKILVVVESPTKARTISRFLGNKYVVKSSMGHVRDLPKSQFGVDVEKGFEPKYITIRGKGDIIKDIREAAKRSSRVLLAPDPDREGEAIAWHLLELLGLRGDEPCRIEFNEITRQAVQNALKNARPIDFNRVDAQQARRVLDRLVGYNLSPLLWRKVKKGLSAGRVQSVAVRLVCEREEEIEKFVPEEYWTLAGIFVPPGGAQSFPAKLARRAGEKVELRSQEQVEEILKALEGASFRVLEVTRRSKRRNPPAPFTTSTLQQEAHKRLGFTVRRTMVTAQQLYEGIDLGARDGQVGLITYIRTDSTRVAEAAKDEAREYIRSKLGPEYVPTEKPSYEVEKKGIQGAHEAIRPTSVWRVPDEIKGYLTADQYRLYKLVWERFMASQANPAIYDATAVEVGARDFIFRATGKVLVFPGFIKFYREEAEDDDVNLPLLETGQELQLKEWEPKQHFTQPPPRFTDATLVKTLEELGIGRPSTYAPTIETILQRGYVKRDKRHFYPTELGRVVVDLLKTYFPDVIDFEFTANMEEELDRVETGQLSWRQVVADFYTPFRELLERADSEIGAVEIEEPVTEEVCDRCGRRMVVRRGKYGEFLACPGFPECKVTKPILVPIGVECPQCGRPIVARKTRRGRVFYGCSGYPECDYVSWDKPTDKDCPRCGARMVEKNVHNGQRRIVCPEDGCRFELRENT